MVHRFSVTLNQTSFDDDVDPVSPLVSGKLFGFFQPWLTPLWFPQHIIEL